MKVYRKEIVLVGKLGVIWDWGSYFLICIIFLVLLIIERKIWKINFFGFFFIGRFILVIIICKIK